MDKRQPTKDLGMQSHPNYKGYDATQGNPGKKPERPTMTLSAQIGTVKKDDLYLTVPAGWMKPINAVAAWCEKSGVDFCPSPFPYQIAKIMGGDFTIVLWASKAKKSRIPFIKAAFEGPVGSEDGHKALSIVKAIVV